MSSPLEGPSAPALSFVEVQLYSRSLAAIRREWRGSPPPPHLRPHPLEDVARQVVSRILEYLPRSYSPLEVAAPALQARVDPQVDPALFVCCEADPALCWYWTLAEAGAQVRHRFLHGDRHPGSSYRELMDQAVDEIMRRQEQGQKIVRAYRSLIEARAAAGSHALPPFLAYLREALVHTLIDLQRTRRHGDDFWRDKGSLSPPPGDDAPPKCERLEAGGWDDALRWLIRQQRADAAVRVLALLEAEAQSIAHDARRARILAWIGWMRSLSSAASELSLPLNRKQLAEQLGVNENTLSVDILRFRNVFLERHGEELRRALTHSAGA